MLKGKLEVTMIVCPEFTCSQHDRASHLHSFPFSLLLHQWTVWKETWHSSLAPPDAAAKLDGPRSCTACSSHPCAFCRPVIVLITAWKQMITSTVASHSLPCVICLCGSEVQVWLAEDLTFWNQGLGRALFPFGGSGEKKMLSGLFRLLPVCLCNQFLEVSYWVKVKHRIL